MKRLTLIACAAGAVIAICCTSASAVTISPAGSAVVSVPSVRFQDTVFGTTTTCNASFALSLSGGPIALPGTIGAVTGGTLTSCTGLATVRLGGFPSSISAGTTSTRSVLGTVTISVTIGSIVRYCSINIQISEPIDVTVLGPTICRDVSFPIVIAGPLAGTISPSQTITP